MNPCPRTTPLSVHFFWNPSLHISMSMNPVRGPPLFQFIFSETLPFIFPYEWTLSKDYLIFGIDHQRGVPDYRCIRRLKEVSCNKTQSLLNQICFRGPKGQEMLMSGPQTHSSRGRGRGRVKGDSPSPHSPNAAVPPRDGVGRVDPSPSASDASSQGAKKQPSPRLAGKGWVLITATVAVVRRGICPWFRNF